MYVPPSLSVSLPLTLSRSLSLGPLRATMAAAAVNATGSMSLPMKRHPAHPSQPFVSNFLT